MNIDFYSFGRIIIIDGTTYPSDIIIYPGRVNAAWWRKQGHLLQIADVTAELRAKPEALITGTGYAGVMHVPKETADFFAGQGIQVKVEGTSKAVQV